MKTRLDKLLLQRGLVPSRERAQALVLAGRVLVNEQKVQKAGAGVEDDARLRILGDDLPYVSRGGLKLAKALQYWSIDVRGKTCLDIGASTGGFTDCLLQAGATKVIAVDTGHGQIDAKLRGDPRLRLLEKTNARYLTAERLSRDGNERQPISVIVMDVSFISATLLLPAVIAAAKADEPQDLIVLVKPQFEVGREHVGRGGIVRDSEAQQTAVERVKGAVREVGGRSIEVIESPILGAEGNREFLLHATF
ncbi:MAG TPA: TlyA family RNA methyltransferase [Candidatus Binatia bacterium]|jgi:23S rRNA (cytidine1920-2'-O)/16S rRNA (cytidine1409-2'-O)-methyltransferase|nr:TlyA family RNA methyltransferase [Candidatus Binatia bacterium]